MQKIRNRLIKFLWLMSGFYSWHKSFARNRYLVPFFTKITLYCDGFLQSAYYLFDFKKYGKSEYLSERIRYTKLYFINYDYLLLLLNKMVFSDLLCAHVRVPDIYAYINKGKIIEHGDSGINDTAKLLDKIRELGENGVIVKPNSMGSGSGIFSLSYTKNDGFRYNQEKVSDEKLFGLFSALNDYIVTGFIESGVYSKKIFDKTCNTVRIWTMIDPETKKAFVARAFHRFGRSQSFPVDNLAMGGILMALDEKTGKALRTVEKTKGKYADIDAHPDSGADLRNFYVPNWDKVKENILKIADRFHYLPLVGWDVVVSDDGSIALIEGNANPDTYPVQLVEPLLRDHKIRKFYKYYRAAK